MDPVVESVAQLLTETLKRKPSESINEGDSPKRKPVDVLNLPINTAEWDRKLYEKISDVESNINIHCGFHCECCSRVTE